MFAFIIVLLLWHSISYAQEESNIKKDELGQNVSWELNGHLGNLLPNQIEGVTEITGLGGIRSGFRTGQNSFAEMGFMAGNGNNVKWKNLDFSLRMDVPIESMVAFAYIGPDLTYYQAADTSNSSGMTSPKLTFGGHAGGGIQTLIGGITWFRADMKFSVSPGTSLYIGFGFSFRFPGGGSGSGKSAL
ncbi:MAG: hypothetical protein K1X29_06375 [Bdellovibrionales bacterium]|nr:hypothetical protein [Bdellovibrionales bacterium]